MKLKREKFSLSNLYGLNKAIPSFYSSIRDIIKHFDNKATVITGDFNLLQIQTIATFKYHNIYHAKKTRIGPIPFLK